MARKQVIKKLQHWSFPTNCERIIQEMIPYEEKRILSLNKIKEFHRNKSCISCEKCLGQKTLDDWG